MLTLKLEPKVWCDILVKIEQDYGKSVAYISWVTKRELGFTFRYFRYKQESYVTEIHLDFDDSNHMTFFRLKYL